MSLPEWDKYYDIYLPDLKDLRDKGIGTYGFKLTLIASGKLLLDYQQPELSRIGYDIKCRAEERYNVPPDPDGLHLGSLSSKTYIRDNNYKIISNIRMTPGDVLELYYSYGDYYLLTHRY